MTALVEAQRVEEDEHAGEIPAEAVRGVNMKVEAGDFVSRLGPSGSGK